MQASFYKISFIIQVIILILFLVLHAKIQEHFGFSDDNFIRMIIISYESFLKCNIQLLIPNSESGMNLFSITCSTDYYICITSILLLLSYFIFEALHYSHFLCKPFIFIILRLVITIILIINLPENISKYIVLEFILEFRLVSLFYSMLLIPLRFIISESVSILGLVPTQNSGLVLI